MEGKESRKKKPFQLKKRIMDRKEQWTKKCSCGCYIPNDYTLCDSCFLAQFKFDTTYDALDHLCLTELIPRDQVLAVLRNLYNETYVQFYTSKRR